MGRAASTPMNRQTIELTPAPWVRRRFCSGNIAVSIYIARGNDTLGPYTPDEAAGLVETGYLLRDDLAARNGDAAWVALSSLLPGKAAPLPVAPQVGPAGRRPWHRRLAILLLAALVLVGVAGGMSHFWWGTKAPLSPQPAQRPRPSARPLPSVADARPVEGTPSVPPVAEKRARLSGVFRLVSADGTPITLPKVRVRAFPLETLVSYLETRKAAVQMELDRLAPLIRAAESEKNARLAEEQIARQALLDADPSSDLEPSLRFAYDQAQAAVKIADTNGRYFLDQRTEASGAEGYFRDLPEAAATADTDPAGEFTLDLPPGEAFAVAASVPQATRTLYWLVKVSIGGEGQENIVLTGDNETSTHSPESLILTTDGFPDGSP